MRNWSYTPSGRLFEATRCGTPLLTDLSGRRGVLHARCGNLRSFSKEMLSVGSACFWSIAWSTPAQTGYASSCRRRKPTLFRALHVMRDDEDVMIGLPDTVWFPLDGFSQLPAGELSFLLRSACLRPSSA